MVIDIITKRDLEGLHDKLNILLKVFSNSIDTSNHVYTSQELAEHLKVSTKTIQCWRDQRLIEYVKVQNKIVFTEKAVQEFLLNHSIKRKKV